jgi:nitroreductase
MAVSSGILKHLKGDDSRAALFLLRRNTHRLEKGLLMRPRRAIYALDYIEETVDAYLRVHQNERKKEYTHSLEWARAVLEKYFDACGEHKLITRSLRKFNSTMDSSETTEQSSDGHLTPYIRETTPLNCSYEDLQQLAHRRRSVRWFKPEAVSREAIDQAIRIASEAPSACNRQPFHYRIYDDPDLIQQVANIPMGTRGFAENIPCICVLTGDLSAYFDERDRHNIYVDASLSAMLFMLALETLNLASCPLNWPDIEKKESEMSACLGLPAYERPVFLIAIGKPDPTREVASSPKNQIDHLRSYNRHGSYSKSG